MLVCGSLLLFELPLHVPVDVSVCFYTYRCAYAVLEKNICQYSVRLNHESRVYTSSILYDVYSYLYLHVYNNE